MNKEIKNNNKNIKSFLFVIGIILMLIGAIMMFVRIFEVDTIRAYRYFEYVDVIIYKSPALGLLTLGVISIIISREIKVNE